ncbi:MAG: ABC transporter permease [Proteobacteria bacterium]|nr:ABC transporter permease [Pseudomonadota bacterium]
MTTLLVYSFFETLLMVFGSAIVGIIGGIPLGVILYTSSSQGIKSHKIGHQFLSILVNSFRSIPYIILVVLLIPFTRLLVGTSIGTIAALIPLGLTALLLIARVTEEALYQLPSGLKDLGRALGASYIKHVTKILIPEALPSLIGGITTVIVNLIGFSAMAGTVGGGGLGDLAIRYGYQRYDLKILIIIVVILIGLVQIVQALGNFYAHKVRK